MPTRLRSPMLLVVLSIAAGCSTLRMYTPPSLDQAKRHEVENKAFSNTYRFAGHQVRRDSLSSTKSSGISVGPYKKSKSAQKISFALTGPQAVAEGTCVISRHGQSLSRGGSLGVTSTYQLQNKGAVTCEYSAGGQSWQLQLQLQGGNSTAPVLKGFARSSSTHINIYSSHDAVNTSLRMTSPVGYHLGPEGAPWAGLQVSRPYAVWLPSGSQAADPGTTATIAALLASHKDIAKLFEDDA